MNTDKATPRPWINDNGLVCGVDDKGAPSFDIFDASGWPGGGNEAQANAELICRAVNSYDAMREALGKLVAVWEGPRDRAAIAFAQAITEARAALKLADGE